MRRKLILLPIIILTLGLFFSSSGCAQVAAPEKAAPKQITMLVEVKPGGALDTMGRGIAPYFQKYIGATVIVENRTAGGGAEARNYVYKHAPDGRLILITHSSTPMYELLYAPSEIYKKHFLQAFIPVAAWLNSGGAVLITAKDSPVKTLPDFVQQAKQSKLNLAIGSLGSDEHVAAVIMERELGVDFEMIPFESGGETMAAVMGRHVDAGLAGVTGEAMGPENFNMLAIGAPERVADFPDMPTFIELGYPAIDLAFHIGAAVREETPEDIINKMEEAFRKAFYDEDFQKWAKDARKPIGEFYDRQMWTDYLTTWFELNEQIFPEVKASMEEIAK